MDKKNNKYFSWLVPFILLSVFLLLLIVWVNFNSAKKKLLIIGSSRITVEVADTDAKKSQGLSGRTSLSENTGMLFIFPQQGTYPFWMKDMRISLDFIWISQKKVVDLTENVPYPGSSTDQLPIYSSKQPVDMVLEVNSGFIKKNNIKIGDSVQY